MRFGYKTFFWAGQGGMGRLVATAALLYLLGGCPANAQTISDLGQAAQPQTADPNAATLPNSDSQTTRLQNAQYALPASQILVILQRYPDAIVEVKSLLADALRQKGVDTQADSITDEQLYAQIVSNPALRGNITYFLRARGYLTEDDLRSASNPAFGDTLRPMATTALSGEFSPGIADLDPSLRMPSGTESGFSDLGAAAGLPQYRTPVPTGRPEPRPTPTSQNGRNVTDQPDVLRRPAPYNLMSLRDLYTQVPDSPEHLSRFGSEFFRNHATAGGIL